MKKHLLWLCIFFASCAVAPKTIVKNNTDDSFKNHAAPYKIFGVGYWPGGYMVLTLTDANNQYFTLTTPTDTTLKVGLVYNH